MKVIYICIYAIQYQIINANIYPKKKNNRISALCILNLFQQFIDSLTSNRTRCLLSIYDNRMRINNSNVVCIQRILSRIKKCRICETKKNVMFSSFQSHIKMSHFYPLSVFLFFLSFSKYFQCLYNLIEYRIYISVYLNI